MSPKYCMMHVCVFMSHRRRTGSEPHFGISSALVPWRDVELPRVQTACTAAQATTAAIYQSAARHGLKTRSKSAMARQDTVIIAPSSSSASV